MDRRPHHHRDASASQPLAGRIQHWLTMFDLRVQQRVNGRPLERPSKALITLSTFGALLGIVLGLILAVPLPGNAATVVFGGGGILAFLKQFLLGLLAAWLFTSYLYFYNVELAGNRRGLMTIGLVMVTTLLAGRLLVPTWDPVPYVFPLALVGILLTVLFDGQAGLMACITLAPLIGLQTNQQIGLTVTLALGSAAGVFVAQYATRNIMFVWVGLAVSLMTMLSASIFWVGSPAKLATWSMLSIPMFSLLNGSLASALSAGMYQLLGRLAHVVTPLQLMELAHPNHPLLHRLMREAPGTYHHSVVVANLAEVAAESIGADSLLTRVGAYYHDIGKVLRPYFFSDNQYARFNVHDVLDARTSATVILDHVREGAKLACAYQLPQPIIDFILQHHGTSVVSHFYRRALQEEEADVDIEDFRYPGPKPQTREAGILMLADSVEAVTRSYTQSGKLRPVRLDEENGYEKLEGKSIPEVVDQIVTERVRTGQLDECALTLRDIAIIKESFIRTLQGIYHPRVDYPRTSQTTG